MRSDRDGRRDGGGFRSGATFSDGNAGWMAFFSSVLVLRREVLHFVSAGKAVPTASRIFVRNFVVCIML